jgi:hypothetical protein
MGPTELKMQPTIPRYIPKKRQILKFFFGNVLWVAFSIPSGSFSLVKYLYNHIINSLI